MDEKSINFIPVKNEGTTKKCAHDLCLNEAEPGSDYCVDCVQLPTRECNFCNVAVKSENRLLADAIADAILIRRSRRIAILRRLGWIAIAVMWVIFIAFLVVYWY